MNSSECFITASMETLQNNFINVVEKGGKGKGHKQVDKRKRKGNYN